MSSDDTEATFNLYTPPPRPDRAAALRDVETLLRRVDGVITDEDDGEQAEPVRFTMPSDRPGIGTSVSPADLAALIVDRVLGAEQDGAS